MKDKISVLIVEDSPVALAVLKKMINTAPDITVVGTAGDGYEGLAQIRRLTPDVICTDFHMPRMNGLEFIKEVMATTPRPILVISVSVHDDDNQNIFALLKAGAVDVFPKPKGGLGIDFENLSAELTQKIRILSGVIAFKKHMPVIEPVKPSPVRKLEPMTIPVAEAKKIVVIGASTGGPQALEAVLTNIPAAFPYPIICVQHISEGFLTGMVDWLNNRCSLNIKQAQLGERPAAGTVYFAPDGFHLILSGKGTFSYSDAPPIMGHRPSVDVTMQSVAQYFRSSVIGVLLTGMGRDGAEGLLAIRNAGGVTLAQDEESSTVYGMPKAAIDIGAAASVYPLDRIADVLTRLGN